MKKLQGERGSMDVLLVPVILLALLFIGAAVFAVWAFNGRQDYKNNVDAKIATAVQANTQTVQADDAKQFAEAAKQPLKPYNGPEAYGSLKVLYPKTWGAYVDTGNDSSRPLDAYFHSDYVPSTNSKLPYNLRIQVSTTSYSGLLNQYASRVKTGKVTAQPYALPKVPDVAGTRLDGTVVPSDSKALGTMVLLPMRDKTLMVWIESPDFLTDFTTYILPNITFSP
ncbi:MAG TPA: hypothetical protein VLF59_00355 [Candidatus Saccharimonadales bacterium]|nr:hypothetical protein [Candidatus Saccharimonadales bacterium]